MSGSSDRRDSVLLLAAAFLYGTTTAQLSLLAVVLRQSGLAPQAIGLILSSANIAILAATLVSGWLVSRIGARRTVLVGCGVAILGVASLPVTIAMAATAALSKLAQGGGFGIFQPAGILYAKSKAANDQQIYAVGRFTAMLVAPTLFAPALGQWSLDAFGTTAFFMIALVPMILALALATRLRDSRTPAPLDTSGYLALMRNRKIRVPNAAVAGSGIAYGFAVAFLPLMLVEHAVPVAAFFTPFAIVLLATRFGLLKLLQCLPVPVLAALGLGALLASFAALLIGVNVALVALAGTLLAVGYSVIHPTATEWSSLQYPASERARPVAFINTCYHAGAIAAVQITGLLLPIAGWRGVLAMLAMPVGAVLVAVCLHIGRAVGVAAAVVGVALLLVLGDAALFPPRALTEMSLGAPGAE
jgi:ACDE family multidrug resistance protein